jgi:translation initiation factor 2B subunit (eIF-2B alpha/beta/delta family)
MKDLNESLSSIFREIEIDRGTTSLSNAVLVAVVSVSNRLEADSVEEFYSQFKELMLMVKKTKPRIAVVIAQFCLIWDHLQSVKSTIKTLPELRMELLNFIDRMKEEVQQDLKKLIHSGEDCIENGDTILIHSHSRTVLEILKLAKKKKKKFKVVLAEQEQEKTQTLIAFLESNGMSFVVVPEYMLSHVESMVTKVFLGGITFNHEFNFVTDAGTNSVVAEFHHAKIPIYMCITIKKFSFWEIGPQHLTHKVTQKIMDFHADKAQSYERIKFSHDRVPVDLIDYVVTEDGVYNPESIKEIFELKYAEHHKWRVRHFS